MDLYDLLQRLRAEGIDPSAVSIGEPFAEQTYGLAKGPAGWSVFFVERRQRVSEAVFEDEARACAEFLRRVRHDETAKPKQN